MNSSRDLIAAANVGDDLLGSIEGADGTLLRVALIVVGAAATLWFTRKVIRRTMNGARSALAAHVGDDSTDRRAVRVDAVASVMSSIATWIVVGIAILMLLGELGVNLAPLIAGAGVIGIAVSFGAQSLVRDFLAGFAVLLEDQYGVGDRIIAGPTVGVVEEVTLRVTRIRDVDGTVWYIRNGSLEAVGNSSQGSSVARVDIVVAPEADLAVARRVVADAADDMAASDEWAHGPLLGAPEELGAAAMTSGGIALRVEVRTRAEDQWRVERALRERLVAALRAAGIPLEVHHRPTRGT